MRRVSADNACVEFEYLQCVDDRIHVKIQDAADLVYQVSILSFSYKTSFGLAFSQDLSWENDPGTSTVWTVLLVKTVLKSTRSQQVFFHVQRLLV